jgi:hypothetical protein
MAGLNVRDMRIAALSLKSNPLSKGRLPVWEDFPLENEELEGSQFSKKSASLFLFLVINFR